MADPLKNPAGNAPPPSYNDSIGTNQGYPQAGYPNYQYGAVSGPPAGAYQPGYPAAGGYQQPKPGDYDPNKPPGPYPPQGYPAGAAQYHQTTTVVQGPSQSVVVVGGCPACRVGILEEDFTCCGVLLAILFFPIGVLCCLAMRQRRCAHCGAVFG